MDITIINNEECRKISGFDKYIISESGRVYHVKAYFKREKKLIESGASYVVENKVTFPIIKGKQRQATISLIDNNKVLNNLVVSHLIAEAFGLVEGKFQIKKTPLNILMATKQICIIQKVWGNSKLSKTDVTKIKKLIKKKYSVK